MTVIAKCPNCDAEIIVSVPEMNVSYQMLDIALWKKGWGRRQEVIVSATCGTCGDNLQWLCEAMKELADDAAQAAEGVSKLRAAAGRRRRRQEPAGIAGRRHITEKEK